MFSIRGRLRRLTTIAAAGVALLSLAAAPAINDTSSADPDAEYSQTVTLPVPPASSFQASGGGDGWDISLSADEVYFIFHHQPLRFGCLNQVDATACWGAPITVTDGLGRTFFASQHSGTDIDQDTGLVYTYTARADGVGGVLCLDPSLPPASPYCGFSELTGPGEAQYGNDSPGSPMLVGDRYYAFNFAAGSVGARSKLLCHDFATDAPCAGQPYALDFGGAPPGTTRTAHVEIGGLVLVQNGNSNGSTRVACFDPSTNTECAGSWPVTVPAAGFFLSGPPLPYLDSSGNVLGACMPGGVACFALDGSSLPKPPNFPSTMGGHYYTGGAVTVGARVYTVGYQPDRVDCYDYSTQNVCTNFPRPLANSALPYTVNADPYRPTCLWTNSDAFGGSQPGQIQSFDAFGGAACGQGGIRVLVSQFVVDEDQCHPTAYQSLELLAPASTEYTSATVAFQDANGNPTGIPDQTFTNGVVDLTGLGLENEPELPQFLITLTDPPAQIGEVTLRLNWNAPYDASCTTEDTEVEAEPTTVVPTITGEGTTGTDVTIASGESAFASADLGGDNAGGASGTVTYTWYADDACTVVASQGSEQQITTNGELPDSEPVTLPDGTYYVIASYSGDVGNDPSSSACGDAVLTVGNVNEPPTVAADQAAVSTPEGTDATNTGTYGDPDGDEVTLSADVGDVVDNGDGTWSWSNAAPDGPNGPYLVTITADDGNGETATTTFEVSVDNVAPTVEAGDDQSTTFGGTVTLDGSFADPGADADWTVVIDWGDGEVSTSTAGAPGAIDDSHQYLTLGEHIVEVCVTDKDGATGCDTMTVTVSNTGGKITGGVSVEDADGRGGFVVQVDEQGQLVGNLQFRDDTTRFHAHEMTALAVSQDGTSGWFAGQSRDGRSFIAYVEDNGEPGSDDIFQLWIDGVLHGGSGGMSGGNIQIH